MRKHILAIDQGTTSTRAMVFDENCNIVSVSQQEFTQYFPDSGWVEHDPEELWQTTLDTCKDALAKAGLDASEIASIGITNQRETTLVWDRETGKAIYNAIVWQDRRTSDYCNQLKKEGLEEDVTARTGLLLDPYFSGTKLAWMLDNVEGARDKAEAGRLCFGTVDTFLIWRLSGGKRFVTDATNASRTLMYNIHEGCWDPELLRMLDVPGSMLPEVLDSAADFAITDAEHLGAELPINGVAGDQQAAVVGQACFKPGMLKSTYGTGCFALLNTGESAVASKNRLLTTIAYRLNGKTTYALEGSIFVAGSAVQWLRDGLGIIEEANETQGLAEGADLTQAVYLVPAFTGMGAPYWNADARGALFGMTRNTGPAELARATLQSVGYQTRDLLECMQSDWGSTGDTVLRVDGGMTASDWTMQFLADILDAPVDCPVIPETTVLGAAWLAGQHVGLYPGMEEFSQSWACEKRFQPAMDEAARGRLYAGWQDAVRKTLN